MWHAWEKTEMHRVSVEKREQNGLLRRSGRRWGYILKRILKLGWEVVELTHLAQERNRSRLFSKR